MRAPYEIEFYPLLRERLADALEVQVGGVRLEGLRDCTKMLDAAGRWRGTCVRISDEIIYFCRSYHVPDDAAHGRLGDSVGRAEF